jgi:hypothetical protein
MSDALKQSLKKYSLKDLKYNISLANLSGYSRLKKGALIDFVVDATKKKEFSFEYMIGGKAVEGSKISGMGSEKSKPGPKPKKKKVIVKPETKPAPKPSPKPRTKPAPKTAPKPAPRPVPAPRKKKEPEPKGCPKGCIPDPSFLDSAGGVDYKFDRKSLTRDELHKKLFRLFRFSKTGTDFLESKDKQRFLDEYPEDQIFALEDALIAAEDEDSIAAGKGDATRRQSYGGDTDEEIMRLQQIYGKNLKKDIKELKKIQKKFVDKSKKESPKIKAKIEELEKDLIEVQERNRKAGGYMSLNVSNYPPDAFKGGRNISAEVLKRRKKEKEQRTGEGGRKEKLKKLLEESALIDAELEKARRGEPTKPLRLTSDELDAALAEIELIDFSKLSSPELRERDRPKGGKKRGRKKK